MDISFQFFLCSYVNWCNSCSDIDIGTAVSVTTVDWSGCTDTRQFNMTVTNSDSVVLYRNSTSCCSGNLTIYYNVSKLDTRIFTVMHYLKLNMHNNYKN